MILASWGTETETDPAWPNAELRTWRWTLQMGWLFIRVAQQKLYPGEWLDVRQYEVCIWRAWLWGFDHVYYDGPHCILNLGCIQVLKQPEWCEKCMPSREETCELRAKGQDR